MGEPSMNASGVYTQATGTTARVAAVIVGGGSRGGTIKCIHVSQSVSAEEDVVESAEQCLVPLTKASGRPETPGEADAISILSRMHIPLLASSSSTSTSVSV